jgi:predicted lipid-binding transport protein (Tim44 family)
VSTALPVDPAVGLGQIQAADPAFDLELFKRYAAETFIQVKQAVEARDLTPIQDLLSDRVFDELRQDVATLLARDAVQHYDGLAPTQVMVAAADRGPQGDAITLRIQAVALSYLGLAEARGGTFGGPGAFTEFWTFSRPADAASPVSPRLECPTCGAPIDVDTGRICHYCRTLLPPLHAQLGWVIVAIQPAQENLG